MHKLAGRESRLCRPKLVPRTGKRPDRGPINSVLRAKTPKLGEPGARRGREDLALNESNNDEDSRALLRLLTSDDLRRSVLQAFGSYAAELMYKGN